MKEIQKLMGLYDILRESDDVNLNIDVYIQIAATKAVLIKKYKDEKNVSKSDT